MSKKHSNFEEVAKAIKEAGSIVLFPHVNPDGDAIGSSVALLLAVRKLGKKCTILVDEPVQSNLAFLDKGYLSVKSDEENHDLSIAVDCGETFRFEKRHDCFFKGKKTLCIDHHKTSVPFCDYNLIDPARAATAELIFYVIEALGADMDKEIAEAIYTGILTDTGSFRYSNTTGDSHRIVSRLYEYNIDSNRICVEIYENISESKMALSAISLGKMEIFAGGKGAISYVDRAMLKETGALMSDSEGITEDMRKISGVEISALLKEYDNNEIKVSMRAKSIGDVSTIGAKYGGGGHVKAAGCTLHMPMEKALKIMKKEIEENLNSYGI